MKTIKYKYKNRYLVPLKKDNLPLLKKWRNEQIEILRQSKPLTDYDQNKWWQVIKKDKNQNLFALLKGKDFIGYCGLTHIDFQNKRGEISFLVSPSRTKNKKVYEEDFWASLYMLCCYGFEELSLNKIFSETFDFRKEHLKIIEKFGFKKEGELRKHYFKKGRYYNSIIHSILREEAIGWLPKT